MFAPNAVGLAVGAGLVEPAVPAAAVLLLARLAVLPLLPALTARPAPTATASRSPSDANPA